MFVCLLQGTDVRYSCILCDMRGNTYFPPKRRGNARNSVHPSKTSLMQRKCSAQAGSSSLSSSLIPLVAGEPRARFPGVLAGGRRRVATATPRCRITLVGAEKDDVLSLAFGANSGDLASSCGAPKERERRCVCAAVRDIRNPCAIFCD